MKARLHSIATAGLAVLLVGCLAAWFLTRDTSPLRASKKSAARISKIDERLLQNARQLATLADTRAEQDLALEAVRLAGQEVDQEFATAIREAAAIPPPTSGPLHELNARIADLKTRIAATQQRIARLPRDAASDRLQLATAELALEQDELADAQQDLAREGGDERTSLQRLQQAVAATRQSAPQLGRLAAAGTPDTLLDQVKLWLALGSRQDEVESARQDVDRKTAVLAQTHKVLEGKIGSAPPAPSDDDEADEDEEDAATVVAQLRNLSDQRKTLTDLDKRIQTCQELGGVYQQWLTLATDRRRSVLHLILGSFGEILGIVFVAILLSRTVTRVLGRQADRRRMHQLRVITSIALQAVALLLILLAIFGPPTQMPTIIGLAGAGLTVVLKDFIVAFFGWFVLMGRNGLRLGDWVEINGVGGEVIEIGVLKTVLLEMGNWSNTGHPTGRHVSFMNGFAIEGHYFNFSTAGQWLWDELQITLPAADDPYRMAEEIRQTVERETETDARMAEQEWERVTHQYGTRAFSAKPASDLRPGPTGLVVNIRYITRGPLRYEVKSRLFQAIVELMHKPDKVASA